MVWWWWWWSGGVVCPQFYPSACSNAVSSLAVFSVEGGEEARGARQRAGVGGRDAGHKKTRASTRVLCLNFSEAVILVSGWLALF